VVEECCLQKREEMQNGKMVLRVGLIMVCLITRPPEAGADSDLGIMEPASQYNASKTLLQAEVVSSIVEALLEMDGWTCAKW
jgi:hypothetical protein